MGVLDGYRVIEIGGIGPGPMAGMMLADMGAEVIRVERDIHTNPLYVADVSARGKKSITLNLKSAGGQEALFKLIESSDVLFEGYRPGIAEKLGFGPQDCWSVNPGLIYGRMTGWGQEGPLAHSAGHDINYIALTGALHSIGRAGEKPVVPLNLIGDFGGGAMFLVTGILGALLERERSGKGQVVDAAMVDGVSNLMWMFHTFYAAGAWDINDRGSNLLDGGAFFYDTYETADGKYIALGPIEPKFYSELVELAGLAQDKFCVDLQYDRTQWSDNRKAFCEIFRTKTRDEWCNLLEASDACFSPVLDLAEAPDHPHNKYRRGYVDVDGNTQPAPAPRFSRTPSSIRHGQHKKGADTKTILANLGYSDQTIAAMKSQGEIDWVNQEKFDSGDKNELF